MKRVWNIYYKKGYCPYYNESVQCCAICRNPLEEYCFQCQADCKHTEYKEYAKYVFMTLHMLQKRSSSLFYKMDKNVLEIIIKYALEPDLIQSDCSVVFLKCYHIYHRHCFENWIQKHGGFCPLDNSIQYIPIAIKYKKRYNESAAIIIVSK